MVQVPKEAKGKAKRRNYTLSQVCIYLEAHKVRAIENYCKDHNMKLKEFMSTLVTNVVMNTRFEAKVLEEFRCNVPIEVMQILESLVPPGKRNKHNNQQGLLKQAIELGLEDIDLLPKKKPDDA